MPVVTDGSRECQVSEPEARRLVADGVAHVLNPFDQATLGLCPGHEWEEIQTAALAGADWNRPE